MTQPSLSPAECADLDRLESVVYGAAEQFRAGALALAEIRSRKLFREHGTFEDYCRQKFSFSRSYADCLARAGDVLSDIRDNCREPTIEPDKEAQTRELGKVKEPAERAEVWKQAVEASGGEQPTAAVIAEVREKRLDEMSDDELAATINAAESEEERRRIKEEAYEKRKAYEELFRKMKRSLVNAVRLARRMKLPDEQVHARLDDALDEVKKTKARAG